MIVPPTNSLSPEEWQLLKSNRATRLALTGRSFDWFFHFYFGHYVKYPTADFQREIMKDASDPLIEHLVVLAFRESGKSTIITTAYPLWSVIGVLKKKYILIVSQTHNQAQQHLKNITMELAANSLLHKDVWPYDVEENELGVTAISLPKFGARIIAVSREQGVRGLRHGPHRPDLIISDDVEDSASVKTKEGRQRTFNWFTGELLPLGTDDTKYITVGNLLHEDSLLMRLKYSILNGSRIGTYREYPLVTDKKPLWPSRFPDAEAINRLRRRIDDVVTWEREYMLHLVPDDDQIISRQMIHYYDQIPKPLRGQYSRTVNGVDLAISENDKADCTAVITLEVIDEGHKMRIYIRPHPFNQHISFPKTTGLLRAMNTADYQPKFYIEQTAYQAAVVQELQQDGLDVTGVTPRADKRSRLSMIASKIERGVILFPRKGCEDLITQLVGFGVERYDDLVDALTMAVLEHMREDQTKTTTIMLPFNHFLRVTRHPAATDRRAYWNRRLDDFEEATSGFWD